MEGQQGVNIAALDRQLRAQLSTVWCPHQPHEKQREFLEAIPLEVLYGGAAGGGKSDALLMDQLRWVHYPEYSGIIFRRTHTDLAIAGALMERSHEWLDGTKAHWDGINKRWRFPSGARLQFGYLKHARDRYRYKSAQFHRIGFDELTQFQEVEYTYLISRLRRDRGSTIPLGIRSGSNPGDIGHEWVDKRFGIQNPATRVERCHYIPATLDDNPFIDAEEYEQALAQLDSHTRAQLRYGKWEPDVSGLVYRPNKLTWIQDAPAVDFHVLALDFGVVNQNGMAHLGWKRHERRVYVLEAYTFTGLSDVVAEEIHCFDGIPFSYIVGDIGGLGKGFQGELEERFSIPVEAAEKQNKLGYQRLFNGALERQEVVVVEPKCKDLKAEWSSLMRLPNGNESKMSPNHAADAVLYGWRKCSAHLERPKLQPKTRDAIVQEEAERAMRRLREDPEDDDY